MFNALDWIFGCTHQRFTFPMTPKHGQPRPPAAWLTDTYVVCLDCGKEFAYDMEQMRVVFDPKRYHAVISTSHAPARAA